MTYPPQPEQSAWQQPAPQYQPPQAPRKRRRWPWITLGVLVLFIVVVAVSSNSGSSQLGPGKFLNDHVSGSATPNASTDTSAAPSTPDSTPAETQPAPAVVPAVPPQEQQAIGAAQDYLNFSAFSRQGLIDQLDSSAGDGYPVDVATAAVDSLNQDWNAQAAKSAQQYLNYTHFSCSGLISQLDSSAGERFTKAQATYGAHQTSACG
jgi:hypothetical protein